MRVDYEVIRAADRVPQSLCHAITYFNRVGEAKREANRGDRTSGRRARRSQLIKPSVLAERSFIEFFYFIIELQ